MEALAEILDVYGDLKPLSYPLASFYVSQEIQENAKSLLIMDIRAGLTLLYDETTDNDDLGHRKIGEALAHTNDELNALSANYLHLTCYFNIFHDIKQRDNAGQTDSNEQVGNTEQEDSAEKDEGTMEDQGAEYHKGTEQEKSAEQGNHAKQEDAEKGSQGAQKNDRVW